MRFFPRLILEVAVVILGTMFLGFSLAVVSFGFTWLIGDGLYVGRAVAMSYFGFGIVYGQYIINGTNGIRKIFLLPQSKESDNEVKK